MNNQATMDKMRDLRLHGMIRAFESLMDSKNRKDLTADEAIGHLVDSEWDTRNNRKLERLVKYAAFRYLSSFAEIDFSIPRNLDKNQLMRFSNCQWVKKGQDIIITGSTGTGKSFIASALGHQACEYGFKVIYFNCLKLFSHLRYSEADGSYAKEMKKIQKSDLLILDDFGLKYLDSRDRLCLLEIMEDRHGKKSTIVASQLPVSKWHDIIKDQTIADAFCDRIVHSAHRIELKGDTVRKTRKNPKKT